MKKVKLIIGITAWTVFLAIIIASFASSCSKDEPIAERPSEDGLLLNDDLIAIKEDDGNITNNWKAGSRKQVNLSFTPREAGVYVMKCNTSSPDIHLLFDRATVKNAAWGFSSGAFRFSGSGKLDCYVLLVPKKLGELRKQIMQFCTTRHSTVKRNNAFRKNGDQDFFAAFYAQDDLLQFCLGAFSAGKYLSFFG